MGDSKARMATARSDGRQQGPMGRSSKARWATARAAMVQDTNITPYARCRVRRTDFRNTAPCA
eukprot:939542-Prymnesium_polylepis.1